ncbi:hypothetical protein [Leptolyngbya ectocarpi]|uniref:hypothetical protein n=1 Tax=Leptolyngbya ectocarpi TaxID=1202 RepID=UPI001D14427C|nr:hypothetical protein [Leptolyngbya ectocarpi]
MKLISLGQRLKEAPIWCRSTIKRSQLQFFEHNATTDACRSRTDNHNVIGQIHLGLAHAGLPE